MVSSALRISIVQPILSFEGGSQDFEKGRHRPAWSQLIGNTVIGAIGAHTGISLLGSGNSAYQYLQSTESPIPAGALKAAFGW